MTQPNYFRIVADWLDDHPELLPAFNRSLFYHSVFFLNDEEFALTDFLPTQDKWTSNLYLERELNFRDELGSDAPKLGLFLNKKNSASCVRVSNGTRLVTKTIPDPSFGEVPMIDVQVEEEMFTWACPPDWKEGDE